METGKIVLVASIFIAIGIFAYGFSPAITGFFTANTTQQPAVNENKGPLLPPAEKEQPPAQPQAPVQNTTNNTAVNVTNATGSGGGGSFGGGSTGGGSGNTGGGGGGGGSQPPTPSARIYMSPVQKSVSSGSDFNFNVLAETSDRVYGAQFTLNFNPAMVDAVSAAAGGFLGQGGASVHEATSMGSGSITFAVTRTGTSTGATGSGVLATVTLHAKSAGTTPLDFSGIKLIRPPTLEDISYSSAGGSVTIS